MGQLDNLLSKQKITTKTASGSGKIDTLLKSGGKITEPKKTPTKKSVDINKALVSGGLTLDQPIKLSKEPVVGQTIKIAKEVAKVGVDIAKQTAIDLFNLTKETAIAWAEIPKGLEAYYKKDKTYKAPELSKSAKRGQEIIFAGTKAGGFAPELGAVKGNVGFILRQGKNKVVDKVINVMPKGKSEPQEVINAVIKTGTENTKEGKALVKISLDAQKEGKKVEIEAVKTTPPPPKKPVEQKATPIVKPKEVSVPREQLPVASTKGVEKISRLEARVTKSLEKTPQEIKDQLGSTFTTMNKKEQIAKASKYVNDNPEEALAVLRGEKEAPKDILKNSIYVAMENQAKEDVELARKLASLASTRQGQELSILTEIDQNSPVKAIRDIIVIREEAFKKRYSGKTVKEMSDKVVKDIQKKVKVDKYDWNRFVESIKC